MIGLIAVLAVVSISGFNVTESDCMARKLRYYGIGKGFYFDHPKMAAETNDQFTVREDGHVPRGLDMIHGNARNPLLQSGRLRFDRVISKRMSCNRTFILPDEGPQTFLVTQFNAHRPQIIPHFLRHYKLMGVKSENIFALVHAHGEQGAMKNALNTLESAGIQYIVWYADKFSDVRTYHFLHILRHVRPMDWILWPDADEFYDFGKRSLVEMINAMRVGGFGYVMGDWVDRVAENGDFAPIREKLDIFQQFPVACRGLSCRLGKVSRGGCSKVVLTTGNLRTGHGQHTLISAETLAHYYSHDNRPRPKSGKMFKERISIHHFKWTGNVTTYLSNRIEEMAKIGIHHFGQEQQAEQLRLMERLDIEKWCRP